MDFLLSAVNLKQIVTCWIEGCIDVFYQLRDNRSPLLSVTISALRAVHGVESEVHSSLVH